MSFSKTASFTPGTLPIPCPLSVANGFLLPRTPPGDTFYNGIAVLGPDSVWGPTKSSTNSILSAMGVPDMANAASLMGFSDVNGNWGDSYSQYGLTADQMAQDWYGYPSVSDMADSWFGDGSSNGVQNLLNSEFSWMGFYPPGDTNALSAADGGDFVSYALDNGFAPYIASAPPSTDEQKAAIEAATSYGILSSSDLSNLVQSGIIQTGDPYFVNSMLTAMQQSGNSGEANTLYADVILDRYNNNTLQDYSPIDFSNFSAAGMDLSDMPLDGLTGLTGSNLNGASNLANAYLAGTDMTGFSAQGINLAGADLSDVPWGGSVAPNLTVSMLNGATSLAGAMLTGVNMTGFSANGMDLTGADLSVTLNLTGAMLTGATSLYGTILTGVNMAGFSGAGMNLASADFSGTSGLTGTMLNGAANLSGANLSGLNLAGFTGYGVNLYRANHSNTTGLSASAIVSGVHNGLNITRVNLHGSGITKSALTSAFIAAGDSSNFYTELLNTITY